MLIAYLPCHSSSLSTAIARSITYPSLRTIFKQLTLWDFSLFMQYILISLIFLFSQPRVYCLHCACIFLVISSSLSHLFALFLAPPILPIHFHRLQSLSLGMSFYISFLIFSFANFDCFYLWMPTHDWQLYQLHSFSHASHIQDNWTHTHNSNVIDILAILYKQS